VAGLSEAFDVTSLSHDGRGVAHADGKAVFVTGALPGERVSLAHRKRRRSFDEAEAATIEQPSPHRVQPRCRHFGVCGGCVLQHLDPGQQVVMKQGHLLEELRRVGKVEPRRVLEPLTGEPWGYRRRARLGVRWVHRKGRVLVGFRERLAPYIADLERCEILAAPLDGLLVALGALIGGLSIRERLPQIEVAVADNAVALVFRVLDPPSAGDREQLEAFGREHGVQIFLQPGGTETAAPLGSVEPLLYRVPELALEFEFLPTDFIQVNGPLNRAMIARALALLAPQAGERLLDLFCGLGNFSLPLARRCGQVVAVDGEPSLIERARRNADRNEVRNAEFHVTDLTLSGPPGPWATGGFDAVLLDPPRAGAREALPLVNESGARRVVYISCHTGSLSRDAGILVQDHGFELTAAGVMDMFPHTAHVESLAVFER